MKIIKLKAGMNPEDYIPPIPIKAPPKANEETQLNEFFIVSDFTREWRFNTRYEAVMHIERVFEHYDVYGAGILEMLHFKREDFKYEIANEKKVTMKEFWLYDQEEFIRPVRGRSRGVIN